MSTTGPGADAAGGSPLAIETHSSLVVLWRDEAHKVRKPVDLGFVDNRSVGARAEQARREVELNSRMAPDVYEGVLEVRGPDGEVIDHVVRMRRLPADRSLDVLVRARAAGISQVPGPDLVEGLREVAGQLDRLHRESPSTPEISAAGSSGTVSALWEESLGHLRRLSVGEDAPEIIDDVEGLAGAYLRGRGELLAVRVARGRIVDGHGDLRAADVFLEDDGPRVIDCLEFQDRFRFGDAMLDAAFLAMELDGSGARDLATGFLAAFRDVSGDDAPSSLVHHYIGYRALVRAKVAAIRAEQDPAAGGADARHAVELAGGAVDALLRGRVRLILVGGVSGSGKSTLAGPLAAALSAELLRTDLARTPGDYSEVAVSAVYGELLDRAAGLLALGRSVVLDATWLEPRRRAEAETVAADAYAELVEVSCTAPREELVRRIRDREREGADPSEATVQVLDDQLESLTPWPDAIEVDTTALDARNPGEVRAWAERELGRMPWA